MRRSTWRWRRVASDCRFTGRTTPSRSGTSSPARSNSAFRRWETYFQHPIANSGRATA
jgi:hypothetical protein